MLNWIIKRPDGSQTMLAMQEAEVAHVAAQVETANALYMIAGTLMRIEQFIRRSEACYDEMNEQEKASYEAQEVAIMSAPIHLLNG